ncbi:TPA: cytidylate kinase [Candidatus Geothermarchaeota archaeon]|nr:cytidylate kinase [Candidatus Geothermarchaeota archaeon]HIQ12828.1 cytidylate kinase [Thermoprotei archaeon]
MNKIIVTFSGFHGVGKSTISKYISEKYGLKRVSSGELFRIMAKKRGVSLEELSRMAERDYEIDKYIDEYMKRECSKGGCVGDGLLSGWILKDVADIKIWLKSPLPIRIRRIADREGRNYNEVYRETLLREESEIRRFKKIYGIDVLDLSIYDYVIDTSKISLKGLYKIIDLIFEEYINLRCQSQNE